MIYYCFYTVSELSLPLSGSLAGRADACRCRAGVPTSHKNNASGPTPQKTNVSTPPMTVESDTAASSTTYSQAIATMYMCGL